MAVRSGSFGDRARPDFMDAGEERQEIEGTAVLRLWSVGRRRRTAPSAGFGPPLFWQVTPDRRDHD
jgi:hypothetical protein